MSILHFKKDTVVMFMNKNIIITIYTLGDHKNISIKITNKTKLSQNNTCS